MLRRGILSLGVAAGLFLGSVAAGFLLAGVTLRHSAGVGLTAAPSSPRPAGQFGGPVTAPGSPSAGAAGPVAHTGGAPGNAAGPGSGTSSTAPAPRNLEPAAPLPPAGTPSGGAAAPVVRTADPAAAGGPATGEPAPAAPSSDARVVVQPDASLPPGAAPLPPTARAPAPPLLPGRYHVQVGSFDERQNADALAIRLRAGGYAAKVTDGPPFRVWVGGYLDRTTAERLAAGLKDIGLAPELVTQ